jgi:hypothetical protein
MTALALAFHYFFCLNFLVLIGALALHGLRLLLKPNWIKPIESNLFKLLKVSYCLPLLFIPVVLLFRHIFPWASEGFALGSPGTFRAWYLSPVPFFARAFVYLGSWILVSEALARKKRIPGPFVLVFVLLTASFASFDWLLSMDPEFHSTIYGFIMILSGTLLAYNLCLWQLKEVPEEKILSDLNGVQLGFIGVWSYLQVMQLVTIWTANLPPEAAYYLSRLHTPDQYIAIVIALFQTALPIVLLFFKKLKRSFRFTQKLALSTLILQSLYLYWLFRKDF